jgi:Ni2+-binding GTPase involved in maturation of urease and hydrogenase
MDHIIDWLPEDLEGINVVDIKTRYGCTHDEAEEAMTYIQYFMEDFKSERFNE